MVDLDTLEHVADSDPSTLLAEAYDRHHQAVFSLAMMIVQNQDDAEAITLEVFSRAVREEQNRLTRHDSLAYWLLRTTRNQAIDKIRSKQPTPDSGSQPTHQAVVDLPIPAADLEPTVMLEESASKLRAKLNDLPQSQQEAIRLCYFEGLTQTLLADRLGEPRSIVKSRVRSGLLTLLETLTHE